MLSQLSIENIAVIRQAEISFREGFNVFTGETGAGKSILIGAIGAVLGARASKDLIRTGEKRATVRALFCNLSPTMWEKLAALDVAPDEGQLLIERELTAESTVCRINGRLCTVAMLRAVGALLIHTHGQQDNQLLATEESHLQFVDAYGGLMPLLAQYSQSYRALRDIEQQLAQIETDEAAKARKMDLLQFEIEEITACNPVEGEEEELLARRKVMRNAEQLLQTLFACRLALLGDEEGEFKGAVALLADTEQALRDAGRYWEDLEDAAQRVAGFSFELDELAQTLRDRLESLEFDPHELDDAEARLDAISHLKKKYGGSVAEVLAFCEQCKTELAQMERSEQTLQALTEQRAAALEEATRLAAALTEQRRAAALALTEAVKEELRGLDMPAVEMEIWLREKPLGENGADQVSFMLSVNRGESLKPLAKTASGGEMSRIMLGIQNVLSGREEVPTLIFDEIDAGISGRAAQKVGAKLRQVAAARQVICVTHLAQVAAYGNHHLLIEKQVEGERTFTRITPLDGENRAQEIARIMNGEPITELALQNATQLLQYAATGAI